MSHEATIQLCLRQGCYSKSLQFKKGCCSKSNALISRATSVAYPASAQQHMVAVTADPSTIVTFVRLERQPDSQRALPDNPAPLSRRPVNQLKPLRKIGVFLELNARSARGIVDQNAGDDRQLRSDKYLGRTRDPAVGPNALIQTFVVHDQIL
jgi:hypothetical protein